MVILLPKMAREFSKFRNRVTAKELHEWLTKATVTEDQREAWLTKAPKDDADDKDVQAFVSQSPECLVDLALPAFHVSSEFDLTPALRKMGMRDATGDHPDFSAVGRGFENVRLAASHQAVIDVNEEGTEAAALSMGALFGEPGGRPVTFRVDQPFLFLIREDISGLILFAGVVEDPTRK